MLIFTINLIISGHLYEKLQIFEFQEEWGGIYISNRSQPKVIKI